MLVHFDLETNDRSTMKLFTLKLKIMKTLIKSSIPIAALTLLSACVSTKKYEAAMDAKSVVEAKNQALNDELSVAMSQNESLRFENETLQHELEANNEIMKSLKRDYEERNQELQELRTIVNDQRDALTSLHNEVCSALKCFTPSELEIDVREGKLYVSLSDQLLFESGSDQVNERGQEAIEMLAEVLSRSELEIMVEGHTDSIPISTAKYADNWDLSVHRATSVTRIFIDNGISPKRIIPAGRGATMPIASNTRDENLQLNRRTEIVLAPKLNKLWELAEENDDVVTTKQ